MNISGKLILILSVALVAAWSEVSAQDLRPHIYYINFEAGSDSAAGTSQSSAWRHAPGDPQASGMPAHVALIPGDTILFRAGMIYRGSIQIKASGTPGKPITYTGRGWGNGRAIMSGRDNFDLKSQPCSSSPVCSMMPNANQLLVIDFPTPVTPYSQIALDGHILQLSQSPRPQELFRFDDVTTYRKTLPENLVPLGDGQTWRLQSDFIKKTLDGDAADDLLLMIQGYPNIVSSSPIVSYDQTASTIQFQSTTFARNKSGEVQFAVANHPRLITAPYEYATVEHGTRIVVYAPSNSARLEVSRRQTAFLLLNQKNILVQNFEIEGYAGGPGDWRGGVAIYSQVASNIAFNSNEIRDLESWAGSGAVSAISIAGLSLLDNKFINLPHGSGMRIGKSSDVRVVSNTFDNIGRTGVLLMDSERALIDHNVLRNLYGSHGNGISIYGGNHDVVVSNNLVKDATRAVTFEGDNRPLAPSNDIVFKNNLLMAFGAGGVALQSWGANTKGVTIERNVLIVDSGVRALRLSGRDRNINVHQNVIDGYQGYPMPLSSDTTIQGNIFVSDSGATTSGNDIKLELRKSAISLFSDAGTTDPRVCDFFLGDTLASGLGPHDVCKTQ